MSNGLIPSAATARAQSVSTSQVSQDTRLDGDTPSYSLLTDDWLEWKGPNECDTRNSIRLMAKLSLSLGQKRSGRSYLSSAPIRFRAQKVKRQIDAAVPPSRATATATDSEVSGPRVG